MKKRLLWITAYIAAVTAASHSFQAEGKDWVLKSGQVTINTDTKELYGCVEAEIDYSAETAKLPVYFHDNVTFNLTAGPENLPANRPLQKRMTGRLRFAYPIREQYAVSNDRNAETKLKLLGSVTGGVNSQSVFKDFYGGVNYYQAKVFRNTMRLSGLTDSTVIYDGYFSAYISPGEENIPIIKQLIRARYNHAYQVHYSWNYPDKTSAENQALAGQFAETYTYLALPRAETASPRYQWAGWLVEDGGSWDGADKSAAVQMPRAGMQEESEMAVTEQKPGQAEMEVSAELGKTAGAVQEEKKTETGTQPAESNPTASASAAKRK